MESVSKEKVLNHGVNIDNRSKGSVTGVIKVLSVCPTTIALSTSYGELEITGKDLKINNFNQADHSFLFEGNVDSVCYQKKKEPLLKRLFK